MIMIRTYNNCHIVVFQVFSTHGIKSKDMQVVNSLSPLEESSQSKIYPNNSHCHIVVGLF